MGECQDGCQRHGAETAALGPGLCRRRRLARRLRTFARHRAFRFAGMADRQDPRGPGNNAFGLADLWPGRLALESLAMLWIPLPYILTHAEHFSGPRLPLDAVLVCYTAFVLGRVLSAGRIGA